MHYGYIGLGNLGGHLAASLLRAGFRVTVHDKNRALADRLVAAGAVWADSAADVAAAADHVVTCRHPPPCPSMSCAKCCRT